MFADGVKLYHRVRSTSDCVELQSDLSDNLSRWSADWKLHFTPTQCFTFTISLRTSAVHHSYSIGVSVLERDCEVRDLGVTLDTKLNFSSHINQTISKANRALGVLLTLALVGGGGRMDPPWFFANNSRKTRRIAAKLTVPSR